VTSVLESWTMERGGRGVSEGRGRRGRGEGTATARRRHAPGGGCDRMRMKKNRRSATTSEARRDAVARREARTDANRVRSFARRRVRGETHLGRGRLDDGARADGRANGGSATKRLRGRGDASRAGGEGRGGLSDGGVHDDVRVDDDGMRLIVASGAMRGRGGGDALLPKRRTRRGVTGWRTRRVGF
jgi:hypothetical protein